MQMFKPKHELRFLGDFLALGDFIGLWLYKVVLIDIFEHMIEARDHLRRIIHKLHVDIPIRFVEMPPIHLKHHLLSVLHLDDPIPIDTFTCHHFIHQQLHLVIDDEVFKLLHGGFDVYVGAVDLVMFQ